MWLLKYCGRNRGAGVSTHFQIAYLLVGFSGMILRNSFFFTRPRSTPAAFVSRSAHHRAAFSFLSASRS